MHYDIFISYKRKSLPTANNLYYRLTTRGYSTFFDLEELGRDNFNEQLLRHIEAAKDIFVILEEGSLDACRHEDWENDWFCKEIAFALEKQKNIIPILIGNYKMPPEEFFPEKMRELHLKNAPEFNFSYFDAYLDKLVEKEYLLSKPSVQDNMASVFKFYSNENCRVYKEGKMVCDLEGKSDEPYYLPVPRKGDYRFKAIHSVTEETKTIKTRIDADEEKDVDIEWEEHKVPVPAPERKKIILPQKTPDDLYAEACATSGTKRNTLMQKAADAGHIKAQLEVGNYYLVEDKYDLAKKYLLMAAKKGDSEAQGNLAMMCIHTKDYANARHWAKEIAKTKNAFTKYSIGEYIEKLFKKAEVLQWYEMLADLGYANAQLMVGDIYQLYYKDYNIEYNPEKALKYYRMAAKQGHPLAKEQEEKSSAPVQPKPVPKSYVIECRGPFIDGPSADFIYDKACAASGTKRNTLMQKAAEVGHIKVQLEVGNCYLVEDKYDLAEKYLLMAAKGGDAEAQGNLAMLYIHLRRYDDAIKMAK